jgi:hypothetical protein
VETANENLWRLLETVSNDPGQIVLGTPLQGSSQFGRSDCGGTPKWWPSSVLDLGTWPEMVRSSWPTRRRPKHLFGGASAVFKRQGSLGDSRSRNLLCFP